MPYPLILFVFEMAHHNYGHVRNFIVGIVAYGLMIFFLRVMWAFIYYHYDLINRNRTTIEHLDEKRGNKSNVSYDMGQDFNWRFVLGQVKACWFFPYDRGIGAPMGDGVVISK